MIAAVGLIAGACVVLVVLYMRLPNESLLRISAARFLTDLRPVTRQPRRLRLTAPLLRPWFWLRLAALCCMLAALSHVAGLYGGPSSAQIGLLVVLDTSYSMSTLSGGGRRYDTALDVIGQLASDLQIQSGAVSICSLVHAVDDQLITLGTLEAALPALRRMRPTPRAGNAALLQYASQRAEQDCAVTQAVVVTDLPQPGLLLSEGDDGIPVTWITVGEPAWNVGIAGVTTEGGGLGGGMRHVVIDLRHDDASTAATDRPASAITVLAPDGSSQSVHRLGRPDDTRPRYAFVPTDPGRYRASLTAGGSYDGDDTVEFEIATAGELRVDWRIDAATPAIRGWRIIDSGPSDLMVAPLGTPSPAPLTLYTAPGYGTVAGTIGRFVEDHPLLDDVSLDVLERFAPSPAEALPDGFVPVVTDAASRPWLAIRLSPRALVVPALGRYDNAEVDKLAAVVFFNGLRWLLQDRRQKIEPRWLTPAGISIEDGGGEATPAVSAEAPSMPIMVPANVLDPSDDWHYWPWLALAAAVWTLVEAMAQLRNRRTA